MAAVQNLYYWQTPWNKAMYYLTHSNAILLGTYLVIMLL